MDLRFRCYVFNCPKTCGSLEIPFPFGTTESCHLDSSFLIACNHTSPSPQPTPYFRHNITVLNISLNGEMRISVPVANACYDGNGTLMGKINTWEFFLTPFSISTSRNKLTAVGCNTFGEVEGIVSERKNYTTGCVSLCYELNDTTNGLCTGAGCCQSPIPARGLSTVAYGSSRAFTNLSDAFEFNPCGYAFVAEDGAYNFSSTDLVKFQHTSFPVVINWAVGNHTCEQAQKNVSSYACKAFMN